MEFLTEKKIKRLKHNQCFNCLHDNDLENSPFVSRWIFCEHPEIFQDIPFNGSDWRRHVRVRHFDRHSTVCFSLLLLFSFSPSPISTPLFFSFLPVPLIYTTVDETSSKSKGVLQSSPSVCTHCHLEHPRQHSSLPLF